MYPKREGGPIPLLVAIGAMEKSSTELYRIVHYQQTFQSYCLSIVLFRCWVNLYHVSIATTLYLGISVRL